MSTTFVYNTVVSLTDFALDPSNSVMLWYIHTFIPRIFIKTIVKTCRGPDKLLIFSWYNELFFILVDSIWVYHKVCRGELARKLYCTTTTFDPHSLWRAGCLHSYCRNTAIRCYQNKICCTRGTKGNLLSFSYQNQSTHSFFFFQI